MFDELINHLLLPNRNSEIRSFSNFGAKIFPTSEHEEERASPVY